MLFGGQLPKVANPAFVTNFGNKNCCTINAVTNFTKVTKLFEKCYVVNSTIGQGLLLV
jgi:hypothetical protein